MLATIALYALAAFGAFSLCICVWVFFCTNWEGGAAIDTTELPEWDDVVNDKNKL